MEWLEYTIFGNSLRAWLGAVTVVVLSMIILWLVRTILHRRFSKATETEHELDDFLLDVVDRTKLYLLFFVVAHFALRALAFPQKVDTVLKAIAIIAFLLQVGIWLVGLTDFWLTRYRKRRLETDAAAATTVTAFSFIAKLVLWSVIVLVGLDNLGFDVTALLAGLGIGGVAVALATQNILGDLFASLSIVIDKPFVIGDFIIVGEQMGTVEYVGLKTTRVRSLGGEQIVFANSDLLQSRIRNYKRMFERRVLFTFGVIYQTTRAQLGVIPGIVREIVESIELTRFDRAHFKGFGDSSLDFEVVYYVLGPDYNVYMDIQQTINFRLVEAFEREKIDFAYPTRTLYVTQQMIEGNK